MSYVSVAIVIGHILLGIASACHALLYKRDHRSSLIWIIVCIGLPVLGPLSYFLFGINRIDRAAKRIRHKKGLGQHDWVGSFTDQDQSLLQQCFTRFARISNNIETNPIVLGNHVDILRNGQQAFPAMLNAIEQAQESIILATYIFDRDEIGLQFIEALARAKNRGVKVYILVDGVGLLYSLPTVMGPLKKAGLRCERFLPLKLMPPSLSINLRNHRKILVIDQSIGFTGGMNISAKHQSSTDQGLQVADIHFCLQGPIIQQLFRAFCRDWKLATATDLDISTHNNQPLQSANVPCRVILDGPGDDFNKLSLLLHGVICAAQQSVVIVTPYFIPSRSMIAIILAAVNRDVEVSIVLPEKSNLRFVDKATRNLLWELLQRGVKVYYQPPPFEHTKLVAIDDCYHLIGSANMDPRSLRLNFELMVEILDQSFAKKMNQHIKKTIDKARSVSFEEVESRPFLTRVTDSICWLFSPYL